MAFSKEQLARALELGASTLCEASGLLTCSVDPAIHPVWAGASVAGPAFPLECAPGDNLAIHVAIDVCPKGSVLVVSAKGFVAGYWGEVLTVAAERAEIVGLVIDGGVRDVEAMARRKFPVFSRGVSVRGTLKAAVPSVGKPISLAGTPVAAGDLVVADGDGVVVIPAADAVTTLGKSEERAAKEATIMRQLREGRTTLDLLGLQQWRMPH